MCHHASCQCCHSKLGRSCISIVVSYSSLLFLPRLFSWKIVMMHHELWPREHRLTQTPQWQPSSTVVGTQPASHTSHRHNLNQHQYHQHQLPLTALLAASTSSIHDGHLPDAFEYRISAPLSLNRPNQRTLLRSVNQDSNWRSRASQRNGS